MAAVLLSGQQLRPSELMRRFSITAEQLHRDLLSLGMTGTFGDGYSGDYLEVHPLPPLEPERFRSDYLSGTFPCGSPARPARRWTPCPARCL